MSMRSKKSRPKKSKQKKKTTKKSGKRKGVEYWVPVYRNGMIVAYTAVEI